MGSYSSYFLIFAPGALRKMKIILYALPKTSRAFSQPRLMWIFTPSVSPVHLWWLDGHVAHSVNPRRHPMTNATMYMFASTVVINYWATLTMCYNNDSASVLNISYGSRRGEDGFPPSPGVHLGPEAAPLSCSSLHFNAGFTPTDLLYWCENREGYLL